MLADRRVKIVATMGPATTDPKVLEECLEAGLNVARLNFSHGSHADHLSMLKNIREVSQSLKAPVAILQDLQGPKIRVGTFEGGSIELTPGEKVQISPDFPIGKPGQISTDCSYIPEVCTPGLRILMDDGLMEMVVQGVNGNVVDCEVVFGGTLKDRKGMNLPGANLPVECLTEKDFDDLEFGLKQNVDYVALSFVRRGDDIRKLREIINDRNPHVKIIAKIEMLEALDHLEDIIELSDAVMVARGDLAVEVGASLLPGIQKRIISLCNELGRPVITATQMLDSMVENPRPTRAEITDVANAVMDGSDALMLSAETASGSYPKKCVQVMHEIILEVEKDADYYNLSFAREEFGIPESIAASACLTALKLDASAIVCLTTSGKTATLISNFRPKAKIIAITNIMDTLNRLELPWGIQTFLINPYRSTDEAMSQIEELLLQYGLVSPQDRVVLTLGVPVTKRAKTNSLRVYTIGEKRTESLENSKLPLRCRN